MSQRSQKLLYQISYAISLPTCRIRIIFFHVTIPLMQGKV